MKHPGVPFIWLILILVDTQFVLCLYFFCFSPSQTEEKTWNCTMFGNQLKAAAVANFHITVAFNPKGNVSWRRNYLNNGISCFWSVQFFCSPGGGGWCNGHRWSQLGWCGDNPLATWDGSHKWKDSGPNAFQKHSRRVLYTTCMRLGLHIHSESNRHYTLSKFCIHT